MYTSACSLLILATYCASRSAPPYPSMQQTKNPLAGARGFVWLGYKDSNLNCLIQSQMYYLYTIPHQDTSGADEEIRTLTRSPSLRPERSASASSATSAQPLDTHSLYTIVEPFVKFFMRSLRTENAARSAKHAYRKVTTLNDSGICESYTPCGLRLQPGF